MLSRFCFALKDGVFVREVAVLRCGVVLGWSRGLCFREQKKEEEKMRACAFQLSCVVL